MKRKALTFALPFMLLTGIVGCESNVIDEDHAIVSVDEAKNKENYAGNLNALNKELGTVLTSISSIDIEGSTSDSTKKEFEEKINGLKSITAQIRRLSPESKYEDSHKKVSESTSMLDKAFNKQLTAIKKEDSTKLEEAIKNMSEATDLYVDSVTEVNDIYLKAIEDIAENLGK
ncbi:DUF7018 domain-containing (lipo)protein [Bacillus cereus]|uniref:DUF7018 domain-containing (lipo)protein n=1 Tax=Bacillus cereus TaxID=1396 RepID=UPI000BFA92F2|nr:hypothetical protein [Bacillus cereus]PFI17469.1 hypothetical protein COI75_19895 [Bacillus cereus]